ncbi:MAG: sigma-54 interaction domain-containing protein [Desulfatiglandales bacterium]
MFPKDLARYWEMVFNTIQDGLMIVDRTGTIVSANNALASMTGYEKEDLIGRPCSTLRCDICEVARDRNGDHWCALFRTGELRMRRCTLTKRDGSHIPILKNASLLKGLDGQVIGAVETLTDISAVIEKENRIEALQRELQSKDGFHGMLGSSTAMQNVFHLIKNATQSDAPAIIFGESGTGKELVARAIHETGARRKRPLVKVNCAALNESLLESELFGHVKGAFTGAYRAREGRFEAARGGDIFLDEIGDLPLSTQVKLLRVLEEKVIERVGENKPIYIDVRIISATNKDLRRLVEKGAFREDLFYRINVIPITVPPLRERVEDIPLLAESFLEKIQMKSGKKIKGISNMVMSLLVEYPWPGNVRELKSALEYAFVSCHNDIIQPRHLPPNFFRQRQALNRSMSVFKVHDEIKRSQLITALEKAGGNQSEAARILGVSRVTVWNQMKRFNISLKRKIAD